ncbi:hypothetical protein ACNRBS_02720 [Ralstonia pseudosolanacearum]|uniref:hypothetical protein n=1 Tax=Ralstonia pseudosolanacearum TaxID=1310165 RepID=UPI003AACE49B
MYRAVREAQTRPCPAHLSDFSAMNRKNEINTVLDVLPANDENLCVNNLPAVPDANTAAEVFHLGWLSNATQPSNRVVRRSRLVQKGGTPLVPFPEHTRLLAQTTALVRKGYAHRNPLSPDFHATAHAALSAAAQGNDRHGQRWLRPELNVPGARPRGFLFVTPARMGRRVIAERIASFLGEEPIHLNVATPTGNVSYVQIPVLRVLWPEGGSPVQFATNFLGSFDRAYGSDYSAAIRPSRFRLHEELLSIMSGFSIAANIGLIIVERINARDAGTQRATALWNVLGQFTRTTGVPLLMMATTGAASHLMRKTSAASELTAGGLLCMDAPSGDSQTYADLCTLAFQAAMNRREPAPSWLVSALAKKTHCRLALPQKVCIELARYVGKADMAKAPRNLHALIDRALYIESPALESLETIGDGKGFTRDSFTRFSDWLPTKRASLLVPRPELEPVSSRASLPSLKGASQ